MKKSSLLLFACIGMIGSAVQAATPTSDCTSHVFVPRGITEDLVYIDAIQLQKRWEGWHDSDQRHKFLFYATPFYQRSKKNSTMGSAFLLNNGSNTVTVAQEPPANINSIWLGLRDTGVTVGGTDVLFSSTFSIAPQSKAVGTHLYAFWAFDSLCWCGGDFWVDVATAIVKRRNTLNCSEIVANYSNYTPGIYTVTQALANPADQFGKFYCGSCNGDKWRTAIDDIQFRLGWETSFSFCGCDNNIESLYIIGTVPTGRKNTAEYIFEPTVGSKHGSVGVGFEGEYEFDICDNNLTILTDVNYRYVFRHNELRSFDLTANGPMSRFLLVQTDAVPTTTLQGINFFTQCVKVTPGSTVQFWFALNYEWCDYNFEVGYDLFWREKEKISSNSLSNISFSPAIGILNPSCTTLATTGCSTVSTATIGTFPPFTPDAGTVPTFVPVTGSDLNAASAVGGRVLTNKVYGAIATSGCVCDCASWTAAVGGSYEFVSSKYRCNALEYWGVFGKLGLNF